MILYHGSTVVVENPVIIRTEQGRDFGLGFYTTDIREQAIRWALRKERIAQWKGEAVQPIVSIYEFDECSADTSKIAGWTRSSLPAWSWRRRARRRSR